MRSRSIVLVIFIFYLQFSISEEFSAVEINLPNVNRIAIWQSKAYIHSEKFPSELFEMSWFPKSGVSKIRKFSIIKSITNNECDSNIYKITDIKIDNFGRLWILDTGTDKCNSKLIVYDLLLFYGMLEVLQYELITDNAADNIINFVIDSGKSRSLSVIYLTSKNNLYVYSLYQGTHWKVNLIPPIQGLITSLVLNININDNKCNSILIETDNINIYQIYSCDIGTKKNNNTIKNEYLGQLLGPNYSSLVTDNKGNIYYILARDMVALKWNSNFPLIAESHDVLLQSSSLLKNVTYITDDPNKNIWILFKNINKNTSSICFKIN